MYYELTGATSTCSPSVLALICRSFKMCSNHPLTDNQPQLDQPKLIEKGASWIQIGWEPLYCDGGYMLNYYLVQYRLGRYYTSYAAVGATKALNYTIRGLTTSTQYHFRIGRESTDISTVTYSTATSITTLDAGNVFRIPLWKFHTYFPS